jgi:hypothetical protein
MNDKKRPIIGAAIACIVSGAVGAIVGYRMGGFGVWPSDGGGISQCIIFGSMIGVAGAVVTSLLLLAAAREKLWLVALVGCLATFGAGGFYGAKQANDLYDFGARMFRNG